MSSPWENLDPSQITLADNAVPDSHKLCILQGVGNDSSFDGSDFGARISSIFVIFFASTLATMFPVVAAKFEKLRISAYVYLFGRHFGTGVIVATAFVHLLDPAYGSIGGDTCVGMTGHWSDYAWVAGIILATVYGIFLLDFASSVYVERRYGIPSDHTIHIEEYVTKSQNPVVQDVDSASIVDSESKMKLADDYGFHEQFAAFLILEFGIIFHSIMIGLNLGSTGSEFKTLYIVLVFHQSFEGLGIGARLSAIPFPEGKKWWPYALCIAYGLSTPLCIAIGIGVRNTYASSSYTVNVVGGILDAISAGVLIYTGLVELLARDYLFNARRTKSIKQLLFMVVCNLSGAGIMALLGKWA